MALWCFPIVTDLLIDRYRAAMGGHHEALKLVSFSHARFWQSLILEDVPALAESRRELQRNSALAGLDRDFTRALDEAILDELMEVATERFHRSPAQARECNHILLHAARLLTVAQLAAVDA